MTGINNVTLIGNIGSVGEILTASNGSKFMNITLATTEQFYTATKEKKQNTQWHNVILWNNMTELNKILSKGDLLYVEGRLNYRKKESTIFTEIVANNIRVLNKRSYTESVKDDVEIDNEY